MADIVLARVLGAHGIKGDVALKIYAEEPKTLLRLSFPQGKITSLKKGAKETWVAHVEGINTRDDAEKLQGAELTIARADLPQAGKDEFYLSDLAGLTALSGGEAVGLVKAVQDFGAGVLLDLSLKTGKTLYLPFRAPYVGAVDLTAKTVEIEDYEAFL